MSHFGPVKWISEAEIRSVLTWDVLVPAMTDTLAAASAKEISGSKFSYSSPCFTSGNVSCTSDNDGGSSGGGGGGNRHVVQPLRVRLHDEVTNGTVLAMPGLIRPANALATKILTMYPGNAASGLPTHSALVLLMDTTNGLLLAMLEGSCITELRTAAASAAATLAIRAAKGDTGLCGVVAVLGGGTQGAAHARVMSHVLRPTQVRLWSRRGCQALAETLVSEGVPAVCCASVEDAVRDADVINTCTNATEPILMAEWVKEGAHINGVGAASLDCQELEEKLMRSSVVYADSAEAAVNEAGDVVKSGVTLAGEVGDIIMETLVPPRERTTIFKSLGMAVEDAVAARIVYDKLYPEGR